MLTAKRQPVHPAIRSAFGLLLGLPDLLSAQPAAAFADSVRTDHHIPELGYAVVSGDGVIELQVLGVKRIDAPLPASQDDRFRIGSNTKTITGFIAAELVHQGKIAWDTRFFDLFPEMRAGSRSVYHELTLLDLLSFRTRLYKYTYTDVEPREGAFAGDGTAQRHQLAAWAFAHEPVNTRDSINFSNLGYVAAGLMLEKVAGRSYEELVDGLGAQLGIRFGFGAPNSADTLQPWGHDAELRPVPPGDNYKLGWLLAAGNINVSLPDHVKFIQLLLQGMHGRSDLLTQPEFEFLLFGRQRCAVGWYWNTDDQGRRIAWHVGNPGSFLSKVYVHADADRAFILFANAQTDGTEAGLNAIYEELLKRCGK